MTRREETAIASLCAIIILSGPCGYGIYYGTEMMKTKRDSGWIFLVIFLSCILVSVVCMFLSNCMVFFRDCKSKPPIPQSLTTSVASEEISVEIVKT